MNFSTIKYTSHLRLSIPLMMAATLLAACDGSSNNNVDTENRTFRISVTNLTANQPLSPLAVIAHKDTYHAFMDGQPASSGLEILAEGGDNSTLLAAAEADSAHLDSNSGSGAIGPGATSSVEVSVTEGSMAHLSLVSMLVNTNDGFTALNAYDVSGLTLNQSQSMMLPAWDAGTEANSEASGTIPGPADGGEGYNAARDDLVNFVAIHRGVISADDGLNSSILDESHRFDNPVARVMIERID